MAKRARIAMEEEVGGDGIAVEVSDSDGVDDEGEESDDRGDGDSDPGDAK